MEDFNYSSVPLGAREIRILELLPSTQRDAAIRANISWAQLDDLPRFSALSYTWGDESNKVSIEMASQRLSITESLETALKALRKPHESGYLWIDQICINQKDEVEKSSQIPLMEDIYTRSAQTVGWLGEACTESVSAMQYLQTIERACERIGLTRLNATQLALLLDEQADMDSGMVDASGAYGVLRAEVDALIQAQGSLLNHPALKGMVELCKLPYFTRGWIQQEIAMPQKLILRWGQQTIHADDFTAAINFHLIFMNRRLERELRPILMQDPTAMSRFTWIHETSLWSHMQPSLVLRHFYQSSEREERLKLQESWRDCDAFSSLSHRIGYMVF